MLLMTCTAAAQDINMVVDSVKSGLKAGSVKNAYNTVSDAFKVKRAEADSLVGTWIYCEPAVYATKGNVLFRMVENATTTQLEKMLNNYLEKCHITPKNTKFTFHQNGTFERDIVGHKAQGVWLVNGDRLILGIKNVMTADITTHQDGEKLMFLIDIDKLMNALKMLGAMEDNKTNRALIKLTKKIPGLQAGLSFVKKHR
ncbi:protein of unknown function [Xylanibacter ruminicola]|uniref:DUF4923 domain-containing protein n=2 Tax=Xylanibacter ruminicola TaxID=839 RepID=A0A1M6TVR9_XYLRU|nr:protein of unknown function [Xylanibacter ruminicola]